MAPVRENACNTINKIKYKGVIPSIEVRLVTDLIISEALPKNNDNKKYPIKPIPLPIKVSIQRALKNAGCFSFLISIYRYIPKIINCLKIMRKSDLCKFLPGLKSINFEPSKILVKNLKVAHFKKALLS